MIFLDVLLYVGIILICIAVFIFFVLGKKDLMKNNEWLWSIIVFFILVGLMMAIGDTIF